MTSSSSALGSSVYLEDYLHHFFLIAEPFSLSPDPDFLYLSEAHADALAALDLGVTEKRGLVVLVGEVGTGKTTLAHSVLRSWKDHMVTVYLSSAIFTFDSLLTETLEKLNLDSSGSRESRLTRFRNYLNREASRGRTVVLVVDEAQNVPEEAFENLRLLLNVETTKEKLLQIILIGQPELDVKLQSNELRHVADRIAVRARLDRLSAAECENYVSHRLNIAGASTDLFEPAALRQIIKVSKGIPRRLNVLCHTALIFAFGAESLVVDSKLAKRAIAAHDSSFGNTSKRWSWRRWFSLGGSVAALVVALIVVLALLERTTTADPTLPEANGVVATSDPATSDSATSDLGVEVGAVAATRPSAEAAGVAETVAERTAEPPQLSSVQTAEPEPERSTASAGRLVVVRRGDTLSSIISRHYGTDDPTLLSAVEEANPDVLDVNRIRPGELIRLPPAPAGVDFVSELR